VDSKVVYGYGDEHEGMAGSMVIRRRGIPSIFEKVVSVG